MRSEQVCEAEVEDIRQELSNFAWFYDVYVLMCGSEPFVVYLVSSVLCVYIK
jgi:hypothetical protein